jgi:molecular chaperone GrpE
MPDENRGDDQAGFDAVAAAAELEAALVGGGGGLADEEIARVRERLEREARRELLSWTQRVLVDMIGVLDDLERAIAAARAGKDASPLLGGIELVQRGFLAALARHGATPIAAAGERFDPRLHEAISVVPTDDPDQDGRVVAVLREGYMLGDQLLRPAGVVTAKKR